MNENLKDKRILVIVESPSKAGHIKEYLKKAGYSKVVVMASVGHIMELANGGSYYNTGIEPTKDFEMNIKVATEKYDVVKKLKEQADAADIVYLMSDPDREGFVISWSLAKFLKLPKNKWRRAITHEITPKAVVAAIENPVIMDDNLVEAGLSRLALDKIIGYRLSPISKNYVGAKSVGRCQSVGLKIIADREKEIQNFKPETYYDVYLNFKKNKTEFKAKYAGSEATGQVDHLKTQAEVDAVKAACIKDYIIQGVKKQEKQEAPKPPFTTPNFQQEAASKLNLSVKDAMACAQKLFENGYTTYLRTDDDTISDEFIPVLESYVKSTYGAKLWNKPRVGKKSGAEQAGHECLRITDPSLTPDKFAAKESNNLLQRVYKMIWQRTIAACLPNAVFSETDYLIDNNGQKFILTSKELTNEGFKTVYSYKDDEEEDGEIIRETFVKDEVLKNTDLVDEAKKTKPPARFSEATLVKKLQASQIGRPSTFATIVETVLSESRGYATKDGKSIVPTERGMQLAAFLDRAFPNIIKLDYTKEMEESLDKIAEGKLTKLQFLTDFYNTLEDTIKSSPEIKSMANVDKVCPECGLKLVVRRSKYGNSFLACSGYPKCHHTESLK